MSSTHGFKDPHGLLFGGGGVDEAADDVEDVLTMFFGGSAGGAVDEADDEVEAVWTTPTQARACLSMSWR